MACLGKREELYLKLHPQTKHGGTPGAGRGKRKKDAHKVDNLSSFSADTAAKTDRSARTVRRSTRRAEKLSKRILEKVVGTSVEEGKQLDALAKVSEPQQNQIVGRVESL